MNKLVNTKKIFKYAIDGGYAIGAFNFVNLEVLKAILETAEREKSPVIVQASTGAIKYAGIKEIVAMTKAVVSNLTIPVCLNLDHGKTFEDCKLAIDNGFTNVMIDASSLPYKENVKLTKKVVEYAHDRNVTVEAELGVLAGVEEDVMSDVCKYTDPTQAYDFVTRTNVDSLAIAIGTSHGAYKFKGEAKLEFSVLNKVEKLLPNLPLVLHGASSIPKELVDMAERYGAKLGNAKGVPENMLALACTHNICKVNVDSDLKLAYIAGERKYLYEHPELLDLRPVNNYAKSIVSDMVRLKIDYIFNSANKANKDELKNKVSIVEKVEELVEERFKNFKAKLKEFGEKSKNKAD